jgi:hypothetical protein
MTQRVILAKKMKDRYTDNHYTITWIISHESVLELEGNVDKEDDTDYHPIYCTWVISLLTRRVNRLSSNILYLGNLSVDPERNRLSSNYLSNLSVDPESNRLLSNFTWVISLLTRKVRDYHTILPG